MQSPHSRLRGTMFVLAALMLAAAPALAAEPIFPLNSRIGMVPPPGFTASTKFPGFENATENAAILMVEVPAEAYPEIEKGFSDAALKARGMIVETREPLPLNEGRGFFVSGPQETGGAKRYEMVTVAAMSGLTAIVSIQMLQTSRATITDDVARAAFSTLKVRKDVPEVERLAVLPYAFANLAGFRLVRSAADGSSILTEGPNDTVAAVEQPFLLIGVGQGEVPKAEERDKFARRLFGGAPGLKDIKIMRSEPLRMGNMQGYEIVAEAKDARSETAVNAVQWLRFGQSGYIQMFAIARRTAWNEVFPKLRTIRDGLQIK
jgi:hypothetical protein